MPRSQVLMRKSVGEANNSLAIADACWWSAACAQWRVLQTQEKLASRRSAPLNLQDGATRATETSISSVHEGSHEREDNRNAEDRRVPRDEGPDHHFKKSMVETSVEAVVREVMRQLVRTAR